LVFQRSATLSASQRIEEIQRRVALWITGVFCTSSLWEVEAIASLILIHFYLDKIIS